MKLKVPSMKLRNSKSFRFILLLSGIVVAPIFHSISNAAAETITLGGAIEPEEHNSSIYRIRMTSNNNASSACFWMDYACREYQLEFYNHKGLVRKQYGDVYGFDTDVRDRFFAKLPGTKRFQLTNVDSGAQLSVDVTFTAIYVRNEPGLEIKYSPGPGCIMMPRGGSSSDTWRDTMHVILNPANPGPCWSGLVSKPEGVEFPAALTYSSLNYGIRFAFPSPALSNIPAGKYHGQITYSVGGEGSDIDLGNNITIDSELMIDLTLTMPRTFQVQFPTENPRAQLVPEGGWAQWIDHGSAPSRMQQELPFSLTSNSEFSMKLRCEYDAGGRCGIRNSAKNTDVPIDVDVTLPGMRKVGDGRPAQDVPLLPDGANAPRFAPDGYLDQRRSTLQFSANGEAVKEMFKSPGSHWEGNVTVVFDANP